MGDQVAVAEEVVIQQATTVGADEAMEDVGGVVQADDTKKPIDAELEHDGNANGNADGVVVAAAAPFELQPPVEETPAPSTEEDRLWGVVKSNSADFNAWTQLIQETEKLGYRVLVVEQTETLDQLELRRRETGSKDKVVRREVCAVLTKGTIVDGEMLESSPDAAYLMSITEVAPILKEDSVAPENSATIGVCFVDTSTSHIMLSQLDDDAARSCLRSVLSELRQVELIKPRGVLTEATERALKDHTRQPLINLLAPGQEFWDAQRSQEEFFEAYSSFNTSTKPSSGN